LSPSEQLSAQLGVGSYSAAAGEIGRYFARRLRSTVVRTKAGAEYDVVEVKRWVRLSDYLVSEGDSASLTSRLQTYLALSARLSSTASASDLISLALLAYSMSLPSAPTLWERAQAITTPSPSASEKLTLGMNLEEVYSLVVGEDVNDKEKKAKEHTSADMTPAQIIAQHYALNSARDAAAELFVHAVKGERSGVEHDEVPTDDKAGVAETEKERLDNLFKLGAEVGGDVERLTRLLHCASATSSTTTMALEDGASSVSLNALSIASPVCSETQALLTALHLFRRLFPAAAVSSSISTSTSKSNANSVDSSIVMLSPPPSPSPKNAHLHLTLRQTLAAPVFESRADLEDARDRVVDLLVVSEQGRRASKF